MKDNKGLIKNYWFVGVIALCLVTILGYFVYEKISAGEFNYLQGKKVDGKDVIYTIGDKVSTADEMYEVLYEKYGVERVYNALQKAVIDQGVETTDEIKEQAQHFSDDLIQRAIQSYGTEHYEAYIVSQLKNLGYTSLKDLPQYYTVSLKFNQLIEDYVNAHIDEVYPAFNEAFKPRMVSHILIKLADPANPTEEELALVKSVQTALENGEEFTKVAAEYSQDGSAANGGSLGYMDITTQFVTPFKDAALALNEGDVSDLVLSEFGYHIIKVDSTNLEELKQQEQFYNAMINNDPTIASKAVWNKAQELNITFANEELETALKKHMGIGE